MVACKKLGSAQKGTFPLDEPVPWFCADEIFVELLLLLDVDYILKRKRKKKNQRT